MRAYADQKVAEDRKFIKGKAKKDAELREIALQEYLYETQKKGKTHDEAVASLCERFDITPQKFNTMTRRQVGSLSPKTQALTEAHFATAFSCLLGSVSELSDFIDGRMATIIENEIDIAKEVIIKEGAGAGTTIKMLPYQEAVKELLQEKVAAMKSAIDGLRVLKPETVIQIGSGRKVDDLSDAEIDRRLAEHAERG